MAAKLTRIGWQVLPNFANDCFEIGKNIHSSQRWRRHLPSHGLDDIDRRLLAAVQENGRLTATELAERVGLTVSPCLRRLRLLEEAGVIRGYTALLDQKKVGLPVSVFVSIKLERQSEEAMRAFEEAIRSWPEVLECYLMTGPRDYLLRVVASDLADYERFVKVRLTRITGIANIESSFALGQVKHTGALPLGR
jgi:Lrp/AsnC family leucine-responsive transcriptional regulator